MLLIRTTGVEIGTVGHYSFPAKPSVHRANDLFLARIRHVPGCMVTFHLEINVD